MLSKIKNFLLDLNKGSPMVNSDFTEKRGSPRFSVSIPVNYVNSLTNEIACAHTHDISDTGISMITNYALPTENPIDFKLIMMDNGEEINLKGRVLWSKLAQENEFRCGIQLDDCQIKAIPLTLRAIKATLQ